MKLGVDNEGDFKFHKIYYSQKKKNYEGTVSLCCKS